MNLPADRIASTWRKYLDSFANCLLHWGGDPQSPSGRRMERLYWEAGLLWGSVQIKHPDRLAVNTSKFSCTGYQTHPLRPPVCCHSGWEAVPVNPCPYNGDVSTPVCLMFQEVLQHLQVPSRASFDKAAEEAEDRRLAAAANFSDEQKRVLVALRAALYTNLGRLQRRRENLTAELQVSCSSAWPRVSAKSWSESYLVTLQH